MPDFFKRFVIADFDLRSFEGHYFHYVQSLREEIVSRGRECVVLANAAIDPGVAAKVNALPVFHLRYAEEPPRSAGEKAIYWLCLRVFPLLGLKGRLPAARQWLRARETFRAHEKFLSEDLERSGREGIYDERTLLFFHTLHAAQIAPILRWRRRLPKVGRPRIALLFRFDPGAETGQPIRHPARVRRAFAALRREAAGGGIELLTDSDVLARDYEALLGGVPHVMPIPHASFAPPPAGREERPVRFGYVGDARVSKGFPLLPDLVEAMGEARAAGRVEFHLQVHLTASCDDDSRAAAARLEKLAVAGGVELIRGSLADDAYFRFMGSLDVVLLPYSLDYYRAQTSGVMAEALAAGKIVVAPSGSWMAGQLEICSCGVVYEPGQLAEACLGLLDDYETLRMAAERAAARWRVRHSPAGMVDALEALGG